MTSLYKYRSILAKNIEADEGVANLFDCKAWVSSRTEFDDPFDSHVNYTRPNIKALRRFIEQLAGDAKREAESWIIADRLSDSFFNRWDLMVSEYDKVIDSYAIYCLASSPTINSMWSNYSASHSGYCIEFDKKFFSVTPVRYRDKLFEIEFTELLKFYFNSAGEGTGKLIHQGLTTKLYDWKVQKEFRIILSGKLSAESKGFLKSYEKESVLSVIFGARINPDHKRFLIEKMPYSVKFKQARIDREHSRIIIEDCVN